MTTNIAMETQWSQVIAEGYQAGCFQITNPQDTSVAWCLYFNGKNIEYVTSKTGKKQRLSCLLKLFMNEVSLPDLQWQKEEYQNLCNWWKSKQLSQSELHKLLFQLSQEALAQILTINRPLVNFFPTHKISFSVTAYPSEMLLQSAEKSSQKWQQLSIDGITPFSRLYLNPEKTYEFYQFWKQQNSLSQSNSRKISFWLLNLAQKKCLYELAEERGVNPLKIVYHFRELFKQKVIEIFPFEDNPDGSSNMLNNSPLNFIRSSPQVSISEPKPIIACIDDSQTVQLQIKRVLEAVGYQVLGITDPVSSLTLLVRHQPSLILMDIKMPEIDGHQLSQMLQKSRTLKDIPIVMLTAEDGMVTRLQSKLSGASYYLKKPCNIDELIKIVKRFTSNESANWLN
ncbi:response regulator [Rippkaea orientalis]|nr:response regulator [Rippkaea orientalis]